MTPLDWFIAGVVLLSSLIGYIRGFLRETISLVAWVVGLWLAWKYAPLVQPYLGGLLSQSAMQVWVARMIILFAVLLAGALIGFILSYFVRHSTFGVLDRTFGVVFGFIRALVVIGLGIWGGQLLKMDHEPWWQGSTLMPGGEFLAECIQHLVDDVRT